jgi:hypothetical protein
LNTGLGIEDGGGRVADEVAGDDVLVGVLDNTLVGALGLGLDDSLDFFVGSLLLEADNEVDNGDIKGGDTEGQAAVDRRLLRSGDTR